jgi:hypothetical protein
MKEESLKINEDAIKKDMWLPDNKTKPIKGEQFRINEDAIKKDVWLPHNKTKPIKEGQ